MINKHRRACIIDFDHTTVEGQATRGAFPASSIPNDTIPQSGAGGGDIAPAPATSAEESASRSDRCPKDPQEEGQDNALTLDAHTQEGDYTHTAPGDSPASSISNFSLMSFTDGGTYRWMSPELLFGIPEGEDRRPTRQSDCYSLGMVIYEVGVCVGNLLSPAVNR